MKKIYLLLSSLFPLISSAQPTITQSDFPVAGTVWVYGADTTYSAAILAGGANQTWDYTGLIVNSQDSTALVASAGTPYAASFPLANVASHPVSDLTNWSYYTTNSTGWYVNGVYSTGTGIAVFNPELLFMPVPFTYSNTASNVARVEVDTVNGGTPIKVIYYYNSTISADGWGLLKLPTGNYSNTLRVKDVQLATDSILADLAHTGTYIYLTGGQTQVTHYHWLRHGYSDLDLLDIDADSLGTTATKSSYYINDYPVSVKDIEAATTGHVEVYPNPANDKIIVRLSDVALRNSSMRIYDSMERIVKENYFDGEAILELPVNKLARGVYHYSVFSDSGSFSGKFVVTH